jgi:hypothetical protein
LSSETFKHVDSLWDYTSLISPDMVKQTEVGCGQIFFVEFDTILHNLVPGVVEMKKIDKSVTGIGILQYIK